MTITLKGPKSDTPPPKRSSRARRLRRLYSILFALVLLGFVCFVGYLIYGGIARVFGGQHATSGAPSIQQAQGTNSADDSVQVVERVAKLMLLPDETPTIAVVSDLSKLQGQLFFANAKEGDVVLMYPKARKAILYSPTLNKIIEVAPITNDKQ